jgi:hypothetical protein
MFPFVPVALGIVATYTSAIIKRKRTIGGIAMEDKNGRKGVSFKITQESIDKLEKVREDYEMRFKAHNANLPIDVSLSKTKMVEMLISAEYDKLFAKKEHGRRLPPISLTQKK